MRQTDVALRCVFKTARQVKNCSTFKNASRERSNATSCVNAGVMPHCHSLSLWSHIHSTHTHTQSDTAVDQTLSHGPSSSAKLERTRCMLEIIEAIQCHVINHGERMMCHGVVRAVRVKVETTVAFKVILERIARNPCAKSASDRSRVNSLACMQTWNVMFIHESSHDTDCTCVNGTSCTARLKVYWLMMQHCRSSLCDARQHSMRTEPSQTTSLVGCFHLILSRGTQPPYLSPHNPPLVQQQR